jgi:hypothetical protein
MSENLSYFKDNKLQRGAGVPPALVNTGRGTRSTAKKDKTR